MAKMFYTMDETKAALAKNEEEIKQYAREGRLREFRDGARLMFKADQVENLKGELGTGGGDQIDLDHGESGAPIGLVDSGRSNTGSVISLSDSGAAGGVMPKDDTSLAADLGLTGSLGGIPSPGKTSAGAGTFAGKTGTATGITIFGGDDADRADPAAQTSISSGSVHDQVALEGVGSGSGLLDLTRESDDTSLGAELLDEIKPGAGARRGAAAPGDTRAAGLSGVSESPRGVISERIVVEAEDPIAPAFGGAALGTALVLLFATFILMSAVFGYTPDFLDGLAAKGLLLLAAFGLAPVIIGFIVGWMVGKPARR
jgi:hypothetical protein